MLGLVVEQPGGAVRTLRQATGAAERTHRADFAAALPHGVRIVTWPCLSKGQGKSSLTLLHGSAGGFSPDPKLGDVEQHGGGVVRGGRH